MTGAGRRALVLALALSVAPLAHAADECVLQLGHGWPPATENHGNAVEQLLADGDDPALSLTWLPKRGVERSLMLLRPAGDGDWTLRYAEPPKRIADWESGSGGLKRVLRVEQAPELLEVPMPATLAMRVLDSWQRTLQAGVPADRAAAFHDDELLLFVIDGQRVSGLEPRCGPAKALVEQADDLVKAADEEDPDDRVERWEDLQHSLDEMERGLAAAG